MEQQTTAEFPQEAMSAEDTVRHERRDSGFEFSLVVGVGKLERQAAGWTGLARGRKAFYEAVIRVQLCASRKQLAGKRGGNTWS
jgi:hypothetical protein